MPGRSNKKFKQFPINSKEDACLVLESLISAVIVHLEKYKEYTAEALCLLGKADSKYISAKSYDDINDKLLYRQREILRYTADCQDSSFSYYNLRKMLMKKEYLSEQLPSDTNEILSDFLHLRNWSFHNPQSLMVAYKEAKEKNLPDYLKGKIKKTDMLNPVITNIIDKFEIEVLLSLTHHARFKIEQFEKVLTSMKNDYEIMYNSLENIPYNVTSSGISKKVEYIKRPVISKLTDIGSDVTQISMAIQKSKYDGTDESFNKWVIRSKAENK